MSVSYSLYCVRDRKSNFMDPVPLISDGVAVRSFAELLRSVKNSDSSEFQIPYTDLELYRVGFFDLVSGVIAPEMPTLLATSSLIDDGGVVDEE